MRRRFLALFAVLAVGCAVGCASGVTTPPLVSGPYASTPPWDLFEHVLGAARQAGYEPTDVNLDRGTFQVRTRSSEETVFITRFYQGGWVEVHPAGSGVRSEGELSRVSPEVRRELVAYLDRLGDGLEADR